MNIKVISVLLLVFVSLFMGCRKDYENSKMDTDKNDPPIYVNCSITGIVKDQSGQPLELVQIVYDSITILTDDNGFFYLKDIQANTKGALIEASFSGYITSTVKVYPKLNDISLVKITLTQGMLIGGTNGLIGGTTNFSNGSELIIKEKSTFDISGNLYNEEIQVMGHQLDPLKSVFSENILSAQFGLDTLQQSNVLQSFGAFNVQLFDNNHNKLNFDPNSPAIFKLKILDEMLSYAPNKIFLWRYDDAVAIWERAGNAIKKDGFYHINITESGWYNVAVAHLPAQLQGTLMDDQSRPVAYNQVTIEGRTNNFYLKIASNNNGVIKAFVPNNDEYKLTIWNCKDEITHIYQTNIISEDKELGNIVFSGNQELVQIEAQLITCDAVQVDLGYIKMNSDPVTIIPVEKDGNIYSTLFMCNDFDEIVYTGVDWANKTRSERKVRNIDSQMELGHVFACPTSDTTFVKVFQDTIHVVTAIYAAISVSEHNQKPIYVIKGVFDKPFDQFEFELLLNEDYTDGSQTAIDLIYSNPKQDLFVGIEFDNIVNDSINVNINSRAFKIGDMVLGEFDCEYLDDNGKKHDLKGSFKAVYK